MKNQPTATDLLGCTTAGSLRRDPAETKSSVGKKLEYIIRDLKKFTSKKLIEAIKENSESRREWMLGRFGLAAERIKRGKNYKIWQDGFHPVELNSNKMQEERLEYIHNNPVVEGLVHTGRLCL